VRDSPDVLRERLVRAHDAGVRLGRAIVAGVDISGDSDQVARREPRHIRDVLDRAIGEGASSPTPEGPVAIWQRRPGPVRIYKNKTRGSRYAARCVACFPASVPGQAIPLPRGCQLVLCGAHRDARFIESRNGRDFLASISDTIKSFGITSNRHQASLLAFVRQVVARHAPTPRSRPGSYAWPGLREAAERVWAAGGDYHAGEAVVLATPDSLPFGMRRPSTQTIRRWWRQLRWLLGSATPRRPPAPSSSPPSPKAGGSDRGRLRLRRVQPPDPSDQRPPPRAGPPSYFHH